MSVAGHGLSRSARVLRRWTAVVVGITVLVTGGIADTQAQPDSVRTAILEAKGYPPDHSARGALWRAVALPGWGQFYNRQYYKIPFVYGGLAALGFLVHRSQGRYQLFRRAHLYKRAQEIEGVSYPQYQEQYDRVEEFVGGRERELRDQRDKYRRRRNLIILGTGLFYVLSVLDAYVSAHLLSFDVGEDLSVRVDPTGASLDTGGGPSRGVGDVHVSDMNGGFGLRLQFRYSGPS